MSSAPPRQRANRKALHFAAKDGKTEDVRYYIDMGINVDAYVYVHSCTYGSTALYIAAANGHVAVVELLLAANAQIKSASEARTMPTVTPASTI